MKSMRQLLFIIAISKKGFIISASLLLLLTACSPKSSGRYPNNQLINKGLEKDFYLTEGLKYDVLGNKNMANTLLFNALKTDPTCDACYYKLAEMYLSSGLVPQALHLSSAAVQLDSSNVWYRMQLCGIHIIMKNFEGAKAQFEYLEASMSDNPQFLFMKYETLINTGDIAAAAEVLENLSFINPNPRIYAILGEVYANTQQDSLSIAAFRQSLTMAPGYPPALFGEMDYYRRKQDFDTFFGKLYHISGTSDIPTEMKTDYLSALMRMPRFSQVFQKQLDTTFSLLRIQPDSLIEPVYGSFLIQTGQPDSALTIFKNATRSFPQNVKIWETLMGYAYYQQSWDSLAVYATEALQQIPQKVNFMMLKAIAFSQLHQTLQAIDLLEEALPLSKQDTAQTIQIYGMLGDLYQEKGDYKKSFGYYDKVLAIDSSNVLVLNNYAYYLSLKDQQLEKAYRMSKKAITVEPNNATYLDTFGWILYKMGKYFEAKAIFKHALIYGGNDHAEILDHYGDVLNALGEKDSAAIYWEMSYRKNPNPEVKKKYSK